MKYLLPIICSSPTILLWILFIYVRVTGNDVKMGLAITGLSFVAFAACVAMMMVKPESKEWRVAAVFNATPFILILLALLVIPT